MTSGTSSARRPGRGRGRFLLLMTLFIFGGGFYAGVSATKRAAVGPALMQRLFGLAPNSPLIPAAPVAPVSPDTPIANPPANPAPVVNSAPNSAPPATPPATNPASSAPATETAPPLDARNAPPAAPSAPASPAPHVAPSAETLAQVQEYNNTLRRIQESQSNYEVVHRIALDPKVRPNEAQSALDRQNTYIDEITAGAQRAQNLLTALHDNPQVADNFTETKPALTPAQIPASLLDSGVEKLAFLQRRAGTKH